MKINADLKKAAASAGRVFAAAVLTAYLAGGFDLFALDGDTVKSLLAAGVSAVALTAVNWLRKGETRFGPNATPGERADG